MLRDDFVRRMESFGGDKRRSRSMHIDLPLLFILISLCGIGLLVLYSASGQNLFYVKRQALLMLIGVPYLKSRLDEWYFLPPCPTTSPHDSQTISPFSPTPITLITLITLATFSQV